MNKSIMIKPVGSRVSQWGEGPIFWQEHLIYVDIEGHALIRLNGETGSEETWEMNERIGTVVPMQEGGFLCAGDSGIYSFDPTRTKTNLADPEADKRPENRFNDGKCDPSDGLGGYDQYGQEDGTPTFTCWTCKGTSLKVPGVTNPMGFVGTRKQAQCTISTRRSKRSWPIHLKMKRVGRTVLNVDTEWPDGKARGG